MHLMRKIDDFRKHYPLRLPETSNPLVYEIANDPTNPTNCIHHDSTIHVTIPKLPKV